MGEFLADNNILVALIWMLLANAFAAGPNSLKVPALVVMLLTAGPIIANVINMSGWLIGFPIMVLMLIQMRWSLHFILRLARHYGLIAPSPRD